MNAQQLRNSILQQAIQGKLVPQDPNDEPASVLLQRIRKEKECLVKEGKLKKKDLESKPIEEDEIPFEIPESWEWCKLNDCLDVRDGTHDTPKYVTSGYPLVTSKNLRNGTIDFKGALFISKEDHEAISCRSKVDENDILYAMIGTVGNPVLVRHKDFDFSIKNMALFKHVGDYVFMDYVYWYLYYAQVDMKAYASGGVQTFVSLGYLRNYLLPLPPLAEQRRIVAKIEELMPLVERYGKAQQALDQLNESLPARLRQSILQEAIQGRLVPQDPKEEPVDSLLAEIKNKKEQLWQRQEIKKNSLLSIPIEEDEVEYSIPDSWRYVRLQDVCTCIFSGKSPKYSQTPTIHKIIGQQSNQWNGVEMRFVKYGTEEFAKSISQIQYLQDHDVLLNTLGNGTLGRSGIYYTSYSETPVLTDGHIFVLRTLYEATAKYILAYLRVKFVDINRSADGSTNQTFLNLTKTAKWIIPLPPLSEQKRIVAKVEELFGVMKK